MPFDPQASFGKSLFFGEILQDQIFPFPEMDAAQADTVQAIVDQCKKALGGIDSKKLDRAGEMPPELLQQFRDLGLFSLIIPEEFGGLGLSMMGYARVLQELSGIDGSVALTVGAHSSIGLKGLLLHGTQEQKAKYFPRLATGELIACFCLTEPGSGSDAYSIKTKAEKTPDGKHYILNGQKLWITNGGFADFFTVFAKTSPDTEGKKGAVTAFAVTRDMGGVTHGPHEDKMGVRASATNAVFFENVKVPVENVIGQEGKGFKVAMSILNHGRSGLGAGSTGGQKKLLQGAIEWTKTRKQFGRPISSFGLVKEKLARIAVNTYATESLTYLIAATIDQGGQDYSVEGAATKVFASEALWFAVDEGVQMAGGMGFMRDEPWERAMRDARINRIYEGTNEINRLYVGLTGMQAPGEFLKGLGKELSQVMNAPIKSLGMFNQIRDDLRNYAERKVRQTVPYDRAQVTKAHESLRRQVGQIEDMVQTFASLVETTLRRHGKEIIEKQFATKRVADIAIDLMASLAVISRTTSLIHKRGIDKCQNELQMTQAFCHDARRRINAAFRSANRNNDEELKSVADHVLEHGAEQNDILRRD
ncbi:MAG: acyl-CoA dehydrogenase family protein [Deltaproteobacteria bacterium]|nr:acyl-CoA dehydrogenase family protein [Deltaproteobacteria bacterium]